MTHADLIARLRKYSCISGLICQEEAQQAAGALAASDERIAALEAEVAALKETLSKVKPALFVLRTMCDKAGLNLGSDKADEMLGWITDYPGPRGRERHWPLLPQPKGE